jgi:hypothetical protein
MRWRWNFNEFGDLLRGPEVRALLVEKADKAKAAAEAIAPTGGPEDWTTDPVPSPHPGLYRESFRTEDGVTTNVQGERVGFARLTNTAPYATAVEYGNRKGNAHHVLSRALDSARE